MAKLGWIDTSTGVVYFYANDYLYNQYHKPSATSNGDRTLFFEGPPTYTTLTDEGMENMMNKVSEILQDNLWRKIPFDIVKDDTQVINSDCYKRFAKYLNFNEVFANPSGNLTELRKNAEYIGGYKYNGWYKYGAYVRECGKGVTSLGSSSNMNYISMRRSLYSQEVSYDPRQQSDPTTNFKTLNMGFAIIPEECLDGVFSYPSNFTFNVGSYNVIDYIWINFQNDVLRVSYVWTATQYSDRTSCVPYYDSVIVGYPLNYVPDDNPYSPFEEEGDGGTGNKDNTTDEIAEPALPTNSALATGLITMYNPNMAQVNSLANELYSNTLVQAVKDYFQKPLDAIMSLTYVPVSITSVLTGQNVYIGSYQTNITMNRIINQYVECDMGMVSMLEYWGNFADYNPITKISIYLPYIGIREVNTDDVMTAQCYLKYKVDLLTGSCLALLRCVKHSSNKQGELNAALYTWEGNVSTPIPISQNAYSNWLGSMMNGITTGIGTGMFNAGLGLLAGGAVLMGAGKRDVKYTDIISKGCGNLGVQTPFFIVNRPIPAVPPSYNTQVGIPSNLSRTVSDVSGYTIFKEVRIFVDNITDEEKQELTELLKTGVYL